MTVIFSNERFMNDSSYRVSRRREARGGREKGVRFFFFPFPILEKFHEHGKREAVKGSFCLRIYRTVHHHRPPPIVLRSSRGKGEEVQLGLKGTCDKCLYSFARTLATYHDRDESRIRTPWKAFFRLSLLENSITCHYRGKCQ